ncbi:hypothetical protein LXM60_22310 [Pandoraea sputorum]|uniref:hypothetical protein n=1 Tax=Pandoraea sputorum TaxID=93222 RepID=UPI001E62493E|nr:hypothetical protein [Pandoraea sputorum]MCE4062937.1 hypothetical protein [Pandoraea sputorum]
MRTQLPKVNGMRSKALIFVFAIAGLLSACAPKPVVNKDKLAAIKSVVVVVPDVAHYGASSLDNGPLILGGSPTDRLTTAVSNLADAIGNATREKKTAIFNDIVVDRVGDTGVNRRVAAGVEDILRRQGFNVLEISAEQFKGIREGGAAPKVDGYVHIGLTENYFVGGSLTAYMRSVALTVRIMSSDHRDLIYMSAHIKTPHDAPYYNTYARLLEDLPNAIAGLDNAVLAQLPEFEASFKSSR